MDKITALIKHYEKDMLADLSKLIAVPSIRDLDTKREGAPFGENIDKVFKEFAMIAQKLGFKVRNFDGYAIDASINESDDYIGILAHLDVVEAGDLQKWTSDPFEMILEEGLLKGRGVSDDKGPLIIALYAMKIIKDLNIPLKHNIRLIAGGSEETTWECVEHYFKHNSQPLMGFSPDGNFPIVNGEKGIWQFHFTFENTLNKGENVLMALDSSHGINYIADKITLKIKNGDLDLFKKTSQNASSIIKNNDLIEIVYEGKTALSRNPQRAVNPLFKMANDLHKITFGNKGFNDLLNFIYEELLDDFYGEKCGVYYEDEQMGKTSLCPMCILIKEDEMALMMDYRYVKNTDLAKVKECFKAKALKYHARLENDKEKRLLYVSEDSALIKILKKAYREVMHEEALTFTKGGASYARAMDNGVAFGATFENEETNVHMPNEHIKLASLLKAQEIYVHALIDMVKN